eukprot:scaffold21327_cov66-Phaeocystis_antarctica.AAC.4
MRVSVRVRVSVSVRVRVSVLRVRARMYMQRPSSHFPEVPIAEMPSRPSRLVNMTFARMIRLSASSPRRFRNPRRLVSEARPLM